MTKWKPRKEKVNKRKPKNKHIRIHRPPPESKYEPEPKPEPYLDEFTEIGGSPVPGITLKQVFKGHAGKINHIAWSPNGCYLASPSDDKTIRIWDIECGKCVKVLNGHKDLVWSVDWSPDGRMLASTSGPSISRSFGDKTIRIWDAENWSSHIVLNQQRSTVGCISWSPKGFRLASGSGDGTVLIWDTKTWQHFAPLKKHNDFITGVSWSPDGVRLDSVSNRNLTIWDGLIGSAEEVIDNTEMGITCIAWAPTQPYLALGSKDNTISIVDTRSGELLHVLEGHTAGINCLSFSADSSLLVSKSRNNDHAVRIWHTGTWKIVSEFNEAASGSLPAGLAFHPTLPRLATLGNYDQIIRIWDLDMTVLLSGMATKQSVRYTTAKLVLVGDAGVGKTGLGWRIAHGEYKIQDSTHGQQFWIIKELGKNLKDGTVCEAVLWDLAGQHVYRPIHSIFLDKVDVALVLFDSSNRQDPLKGVRFWLEQLKGKNQLPPSVLVGARVDRGSSVLSQQEVDQFCQHYGISGGYIGTSAKNGEGLRKLMATVKAQIPWEHMTTTVTTVTFKRIKQYVLSLKEKTERKSVLVLPAELRQQLQSTDKDWLFTDAEMMTAVGHLENHGYVTILTDSDGSEHILLKPDLLAGLASSIVIQADKNPRELGAINESELLQDKYAFDELKGLEKSEGQILLDASILRLLEHSICFRETLGNDTLLIFPGLIKQKRPLKDDIQSTDDISYIVHGRVENIYASLVVLLGYTPSFTRINQWQNQAQYETSDGKICGFRLIEEREGEIEFILYFGNEMHDEGKQSFRELFEQFLYQRDIEVNPFPPVICGKGHRQERATVVKRLREGKTFVFCEECGEKTDLPRIREPQIIGTSASPWLQREEAMARLRNTYETYLSRAKSYRREWAKPRCYISCIPEQAKFAEDLTHDLADAGVYLIGKESSVQKDDFVIILDSPSYQRNWKSVARSLKEDIKLIEERFDKPNLISIVLEGEDSATTPHEARDCRPGDFFDETHYPVSLFNLVLNLYAIPLNHPGFAPLRKSLHQQWERDLAGRSEMNENESTEPLNVFISYSHKDEEFKDELVTMLAGLERRGVIDAWQDRRIEEGDEWYQEIQNAINNCDLGVLLISSNFIASRFIQDDELPKLLRRRMEGGLRIIPVIVRQCLWQSEPVLKDLLALPRDGTPVINFSKNNGDRDQVWTDIAKAIKEHLKM